MFKLAAMNLNMATDSLVKLMVANIHHESFLKNPVVRQETLDAAARGDKMAKLFLQQNKHVKNPADTLQWIKKNLNAQERLSLDVNSSGGRLGLLEEKDFNLLKNAVGADKVKVKQNLEYYNHPLVNTDFYRELNLEKLHNAYEDTDIAVNKLKTEAERFYTNNDFIKKDKKQDNTLKKILRKLWNE